MRIFLPRLLLKLLQSRLKYTLRIYGWCLRGRSLMLMAEFLEAIWGCAYFCDVIFVKKFCLKPFSRWGFWFSKCLLPFLLERSNELVCGIHPVSRTLTRIKQDNTFWAESICVEWLPINEFLPGQRVCVEIPHSMVMSLNLSKQRMCQRHELDAHVGNSRSHLRWFIFLRCKFW